MKLLLRIMPIAAAGVLVLTGLLGLTARDEGGGAVAGSSDVGGFVSDAPYPGVASGVAFAFAPDGRIFVASLRGEVYIIRNGVLLPTPFVTVPANANGERGLMGLALDPNFASNGYVYVYYTTESDISSPQGPRTARLVRFTAAGDVASIGSEHVLLGTVVGTLTNPSCEDFPVGADCIPADGLSHVGGALRFSPDGALLLATGDGAFFPGVASPLSLRSQNLDSLAGKLLRIDPATGNGLPGNPLYAPDDPDSNRSKVWSYGLRQGFRMGVQPETGKPFVGEVGSRFWEEINVGEPGANFGWPCYEGANRNADYAGFPLCQGLYASEPSTLHPLHAYSHGSGAAIVGGQFYEGASYPAEFNGAYFFGDWLQETISVLKVDGSGQLTQGGVLELLRDAGNPVDFAIGPDGDVYYLSLGAGATEIRHLRYVSGNRPPVARATGTPQGGLAPLRVDFSSSGSFDPDGGSLTYAWTFGDGTTSSQQQPAHTYTRNGPFTARLTVTDDGGATAQDSVVVTIGNRLPDVTISRPAERDAYEGGQSLLYSGFAIDPDGGSSPSLAWSIYLHHCEPVSRVCHKHPFVEGGGNGGKLTAPGQGDEIFYLELQLTATDSQGLSTTAFAFTGEDSDSDGLFDFEELLRTETDRFDADTDHDGVADGQDDNDDDRCANAKELGQEPAKGGGRNPLDGWDYFNPTSDGINRSDDVLAVIGQYFVDEGEAGYSAAYDRTLVGAKAWMVGAPDGRGRIDDVVAIVRQYGHDCV